MCHKIIHNLRVTSCKLIRTILVLTFTGRNEVVAKVMFLHVCVILFTGGVSGQGEPPHTRETSPQVGRTPPPGPGRPPQTRQTPPRPGRHPPRPPGPGVHPPDQADTPQTRQTPPRPGRHPPDLADHPPGKQTPEYGLPVAGTHPTGMHSCCIQ